MVPVSPAPAIIAMKIRKIINQFEQRGAFTPDRAISLEEMGLSDSLIFRRLVSRGVIVEAWQNRYYLNQGNLADFYARRRKMVTIVLGVIVLVAVVYMLLQVNA